MTEQKFRHFLKILSESFYLSEKEIIENFRITLSMAAFAYSILATSLVVKIVPDSVISIGNKNIFFHGTVL